jgi:hypothetical protein
MEETLIKQAPMMAWKNRKAMLESALCGCYQCLAIMSTEDIEEWTDYGMTAMCPKCGCDCLIPQSNSIPMDEGSMKELKDHWLSR